MDEISKRISEPLQLRVWGERACFTRPEMKVERVSYDVMTPSAARGVSRRCSGNRRCAGSSSALMF